MIQSRIRYYYKLHPVMIFLLLGVSILIVFSLYTSQLRMMTIYRKFQSGVEDKYPFRNLVMVAWHSVYTSTSCEDVEKENSWFLEPYQKHLGQASTFVAHIKKGVEIIARDDEGLLLFSGGETRKDAGPRSEAQSYWMVAESKGWFGHQEVRPKALTEEHARDSFENLLFSVCRFHELTGSYPRNITERFVDLHRLAIGFPKTRLFYSGTPIVSTSRDAALKGEALVRMQFREDLYGCFGSLRRKKIGRDPFHRSIPYPSGCPEIEGLFGYCGPTRYPGSLPWA